MNWSSEWKAPPVIANFTDEQTKEIENILKYGPAGVIINKIPTHDPHTNPNAFLYYECKCGERLDPHTKSFAGLNNTASLAGWKIRWGSDSYMPYCPKCGEEVE